MFDCGKSPPSSAKVMADVGARHLVLLQGSEAPIAGPSKAKKPEHGCPACHPP